MRAHLILPLVGCLVATPSLAAKTKIFIDCDGATAGHVREAGPVPADSEPDVYLVDQAAHAGDMRIAVSRKLEAEREVRR